MSVYDDVSPGSDHYPQAPPGAVPGVPSQVRRPFPSPEERRKNLIEDLSRHSHFLSLKEFLDVYDRYGNDERAAVEGYAKYKELYLEEQYKDFYERNKSCEWFQDYFMPSRSKQLVQRQREEMLLLKNTWDEHAGQNLFRLEEKANIDRENALDDELMGLDQELEEGEDVQALPVAADRTTLQFYSDHFTTKCPFLFIRSVHPGITQQMLADVCRNVSDFAEVYFGAPSASRRWFKPAWITFHKPNTQDTETVDSWMDERWKAIDGLVINQFELRANLYSKPAPKLRVTAKMFSANDRMAKDLVQALKALCRLSEFYNVPLPDFYEENPAFSEEMLDKTILHLRCIFKFCYYCGCEYKNEFELYKECGTLHLRTASKSQVLTTETQDSAAPFDLKLTLLLNNLESLKKARELATYDDFISDLDEVLQKAYVLVQNAASDVVDDERSSAIKSRCSLCMKLFKGPEYVIKHLHLKHLDEVSALRETCAMQKIFRLNKTIFKDAILAERSLSSSTRSNVSARKPDPDRYFGPGYTHQYPQRTALQATRPLSTGSSHRAAPYVRPTNPSRLDREVRSYLDLDAPVSGLAKSSPAKLDYGSLPIGD